jgi:purine nucleosidase
VFNAGWPLTMVGLDLTYQALATPEVIARIAELDTGPARFVCQLLKVLRQDLQGAAGLRGAASA